MKRYHEEKSTDKDLNNEIFAEHAYMCEGDVWYLDSLNMNTTRHLQEVGFQKNQLHVVENQAAVFNKLRDVNLYHGEFADKFNGTGVGSVYFDAMGNVNNLKQIPQILEKMVDTGKPLVFAYTYSQRLKPFKYGRKKINTVAKYLDVVTNIVKNRFCNAQLSHALGYNKVDKSSNMMFCVYLINWETTVTPIYYPKAIHNRGVSFEGYSELYDEVSWYGFPAKHHRSYCVSGSIVIE